MYPPQLLDHFEHPRNSGVMDSPDVSVQAENPACGDVMKLMLRIGNGQIVEAKYQVRGCVASIACGSALTEAISGRDIDAAAALQREDVVNAVGGLAKESLHASHLAMDCLKLALRQLKR
jgi:nitrogen fixation NifU-like protein